MIYDCFSFFNELDLLEIRLNILNDTVDKFVISEATLTHSGKPKPLYYAENKERFAAFQDKIIYIVIDNFPPDATPWERENIQRNELVRGLVDAKPDDVILISDLDEIPDPDIVRRESTRPGVKRLLMMLCNYYVNLVNMVAPVWHLGTVKLPFSALSDPNVLAKQKLGEFTPASVNKGNTFSRFRYFDIPKLDSIPNAGWHFSYLGGADKIIEKIKALSEQCYNTPAMRTKSLVLERIKNGEDIYGRGEKYFGVRLDERFPKYLRDNRDKYADFIYEVTDEYLRTTRWKRGVSSLYGRLRRFIVAMIPRFLVMPLYHLRAKVLDWKAVVANRRRGTGQQ